MPNQYTNDPFLLTNSEGVRHAVKGNIKISVFPDVEDVKIMHRCVVSPIKSSSVARILKMEIGDLKIFVNNDNFIITKQEVYPKPISYDLNWCVENILKHVKVEKVDGRYTINTEENLEKLKELVNTSIEYKNVEAQDVLNSNVEKLLDKD